MGSCYPASIKLAGMLTSRQIVARESLDRDCRDKFGLEMALLWAGGQTTQALLGWGGIAIVV